MSDTETKNIATPENNKPSKLKHRQWGAATLGLLFGIAGLIGGRLGHLYPHFDVFSQFGVQFIAIVLAFSFALIFKRYKFFMGVAGTVLLLAVYGAWPHLSSTPLNMGPFTLQSGEKQLRIAHFNTFANNRDFAAITTEVLRLDADVVSLVELDSGKKAKVLPALQAKYPYIFDCTGKEYCELSIVSKFPIVEAEGNGHWVGAPYVMAKLGGEMAGVTFVGVHTTRFPHSRAQLKQVTALAKMLETVTGDLVVMGDFNTTPFSRLPGILEKGANLSRLTDMPTWPSHIEMPQLAIDHAFASQNFRVIGNQQIGESAGSDHYPIVLTLALKRP